MLTQSTGVKFRGKYVNKYIQQNTIIIGKPRYLHTKVNITTQNNYPYFVFMCGAYKSISLNNRESLYYC